jgi:molecular chaperone GrpE
VRADHGDGFGSDEPRPAGPEGPDSRPAGPVAGDAPSPSQATGEGPTPTPPTGGTSGDAPGSASPAEAPDLDRVEHDLDALLGERDEYLDLAKRTKADFENYRKRMAAEVQAATLRGKAALASGLIKVIDTLELALDAAGIDPAGDKAPEDGLAEGILLTYRQLCETLKQAGVEPYDPAGEVFDPAWHEALQKLHVEGTEAGTVVEVLQKGYRLDGQVLRAARVVVSE